MSRRSRLAAERGTLGPESFTSSSSRRLALAIPGSTRFSTSWMPFGLINTDFSGSGTRGRSRVIKIRYEPEEILKRIGGNLHCFSQ